VSGLLERVPFDQVIVAIDPGKALNRVWVTAADGLVGAPESVPASRVGIDRLSVLLDGRGAPVFAIEATGSLHRAWAAELERRWPGSLRVFAPSQTQAARAQLGARRFKTDDRDCAALVWLARQGAGRPAAASGVEALLAAVARRRQLILALTPLRQRLHDQLNALAPGLSAPAGHGRVLLLDTPTGRAVLACAAAFAGRPPTPRSLQARAGGRLTDATARFWAERWKQCLTPPADAELRAARLGRDLTRFEALQADIAFVDGQLEQLLARQPRPDSEHPARRRDRPRRRLRGAHPPDRAVRHARTPLFGHRPGSGQLRVRVDPTSRRDQPHRAARTPRRADRHRLGPRAVRARLPAAPGRAQRPRQDRHPGHSRARPPRLPAVLANA